MSTDLITYFSERYYHNVKTPSATGPFLTISRETGCGATELARNLVREFRKNGVHWHFVNKEVLEQSAKQLQLDQQKLVHKLEIEHQSQLDEIVWAFGERYYKSEKKIRETISQVIRHYASMGKIIIVGRAGVAILHEMKKGLHIRLEAPVEWRIQSLVKRKLTSENSARLFIKDTDKKRNLMLEQFSGKPLSEIYFDLRFNTATFSEKQMIEMIIKAMEQKGLIE